jgi:hypothetical protein
VPSLGFVVGAAFCASSSYRVDVSPEQRVPLKGVEDGNAEEFSVLILDVLMLK